MELRDWARAVLLGTRLEDKLLAPDGLEDAAPGAPLHALAAPGRGPELALARGARAPFPGLEGLEDPARAAQALHAFANHELVALELIALALLRFPEAPPELRRGLANTLLEEQGHLRGYLERLRVWGVSLGELPLNAAFWAPLAGAPSLQAFVAQLSLTVEQANLDHALEFAAAFRAAGDLDSAALLERVYREELGHVGLGLSWLRRWREPGEDDWDAYRRLLPPPLTPRRAKGTRFHPEARRALGFSERFVRELEVFSSSRGRPPRVLLFNPGCELELADGRADLALPRAVREVAADGALTLLALTGKDDLLLVERRPRPEHLAALQAAGLELPELVEAGDRPAAALQGRLLGGLRPWGWSPASRAALAPLAEQLSGQGPDAWLPPARELAPGGAWRELSGKAWCAELAGCLWEEAPHYRDGLAEERAWLPAAARDAAELERARAAFAAVGVERLVLKACWGTSGQGALRVAAREPWSPAEEGFADGVLRRQGALVLEPWRERSVDLSWQLEVGGEGAVRSLGLTRFLTDRRGQYAGHVLGRPLDGLEPEALRLLHGAGGQDLLEATALEAGRRLAAAGYRGPVGVDAFLHTVSGELRLRALVELNPRLTMGRVALRLSRRLAPARTGLFLPVALTELSRRGFADAPALAAALASQAPLERDRRGGWRQGALLLTDPHQARAQLYLVLVGEGLAACRAAWEALAPC